MYQTHTQAKIKTYATGQSYKQNDSFLYLGAASSKSQTQWPKLPEASPWCGCVKNYKEHFYDQPNVPATFKVRMVKAQMVEVLFDGCALYILRQDHDFKLHTIHHHIPLRIIEVRGDESERTTPYLTTVLSNKQAARVSRLLVK